jgi:hypothetical protein
VGDWPISGIEMPYYTAEAIARRQRGSKPPAGLLLRNATKNELIDFVGAQCSAVAATNDD